MNTCSLAGTHNPDVTKRMLQSQLPSSVLQHQDKQDKNQPDSERDQALKMEALGQLAAGISHEINTPMQYVTDNMTFISESLLELMGAFRNSAERTEDQNYLISEMPQAMDQALQGLKHISRILSAIKEFAHPNSATKVMADLHRIIEVSAILSRNQWKYCAQLTLNLCENMPLVLCISGQIQQVILNMITNAAQAIEDKRHACETPSQEAVTESITIATSHDENMVEIRISDTGCGIPQADFERIFHPFFTTKNIGRGTGQGLALCHDIIVNRHSGFVNVTSELGVGTTFHIQIPLHSPAH